MIFRKAKVEDLDAIEEIIDGAVEFMRRSGQNQWQDGYPNRNVFELDIGNGIAYVLRRRRGCGSMRSYKRAGGGLLRT